MSGPVLDGACKSPVNQPNSGQRSFSVRGFVGSCADDFRAGRAPPRRQNGPGDGASRGIGRAVAGALAAAGAKVVVTARDTDGVTEAVAGLRRSGAHAADRPAASGTRSASAGAPNSRCGSSGGSTSWSTTPPPTPPTAR
ncbi:SDR family NAD(P)-dependent oxidoreductase [Streptomyces sp. NPDC002402]